jgi:hypothetical protein
MADGGEDRRALARAGSERRGLGKLGREEQGLSLVFYRGRGTERDAREGKRPVITTPMMAINAGLHNGEEMRGERRETIGRLWLRGSRAGVAGPRGRLGRGATRERVQGGGGAAEACAWAWQRRVQGRKKGAEEGPTCKREGGREWRGSCAGYWTGWAKTARVRVLADVTPLVLLPLTT